MKLYYAQKSPFVRKVLVVANEIGIAENLDPELEGDGRTVHAADKASSGC